MAGINCDTNLDSLKQIETVEKEINSSNLSNVSNENAAKIESVYKTFINDSTTVVGGVRLSDMKAAQDTIDETNIATLDLLNSYSEQFESARKKELEDLSKMFSELNRVIQELNRNITNLENEINNLENEISELENDNEEGKNNQAIAEKNEAVGKKNEQIKELTKKRDEYVGKKNNVTQRITTVNTYKNPVTDIISDYKSKVASYTKITNENGTPPSSVFPVPGVSPTVASSSGPGGSSGGGSGPGGIYPAPTVDPVIPIATSYRTPEPTRTTPTPTRTTPTPTRTTPTPTRTTINPTGRTPSPIGTTLSPTGTTPSPTTTDSKIVTSSPTSYVYRTGGGAGFFQNTESDEFASTDDLDILEEANLDEVVDDVEQVPVMNSVKPVDKPVSKGSSTLATIAGIGAAGSVAGGLAYVAKKKKDEESDELDDFITDDEELSNDALELSSVEDKDWLYDVGLDIPSMDSKNNDVS